MRLHKITLCKIYCLILFYISTVIMRALNSRKLLFVAILLVLFIFHYKLKLKYVGYRVIWTERYMGSYRMFVDSEIKQRGKKDKGDLKYILQWTSPNNVPFVYMGKGREGFIDRNCPYTKCIVTSNRSYFSDHSKFDVIAFAGPELSSLRDLPLKRAPHQKFVYASIESAHNYPVCTNKFDGFFNWTWTYRLDSEVRWGYIVIRNKSNALIGPNKLMNWMKLEDMDPVSDKLKKQLINKNKAVAWFVSNCYSKTYREVFAKLLKKELHKYKLEMHVYGKCGDFECSRDNEYECDQLIRDNYYFYLSFENAFSEDYVTEKLLRALQNNAIPIVYGGANYTRFMPDGIYLNGRELGVKNLAKKINELINEPEKYSEYFKWKNHYSYHRMHLSVETEPYCLFCTTLHNKEMVKKTTIYKDFRKWWNPPNICYL